MGNFFPIPQPIPLSAFPRWEERGHLCIWNRPKDGQVWSSVEDTADAGQLILCGWLLQQFVSFWCDRLH